jgi:hypothetical protein
MPPLLGVISGGVQAETRRKKGTANGISEHRIAVPH